MKTYIIEQKIVLIANQYFVYEANDTGEKGKLVAFAHQKRFAFREKFTFYTDKEKKQVLFEVKARQVIDFNARYDVFDESGKVLGVIGKAFRSSLLRSTWNVFTPKKETTPLVVAQERNKALAIVRRAWEVLPYISEIPFFVKYHFDFTNPATGKIVATYNKTTTFRDHYRLQVEDELLDQLDPRVLLALGVMMDAMQSR